MFVRKADESDCRAVFDWRNDQHSREMSFAKGSITYEQHTIWFAETLSNKARLLLIGEVEGNKVGVCRFDSNNDRVEAEISININPCYRGQGLGKQLLAAAIDVFECENDCLLIARAKNGNEASKHLFLSAGFKVVSTGSNMIEMHRPINVLTFHEVSSDDVEILYDMLGQRTHNISHQSMPEYDKHKEFVLSQPYEHWYLIKSNKTVIGSFYIQRDNSVGLNLSFPTLRVVKETIEYIESNFKPSAPIPSKVPPYFFTNIAIENKQLAQILEQIGYKQVQVSYKLVR